MPLRDRPTLRTALALAALSAWLVLLFSGWTAAGAVHLLLVVAVALFPWRAAVARDRLEGAGGTQTTEERP